MKSYLTAFLLLASPALVNPALAGEIDGTWSALGGHTALTLDTDAGQYRLIENTSIRDGNLVIERQDGPVYTLNLDGDRWTLIVQSYEPGKYLNGTIAREGDQGSHQVRFTP
jgi:hypothetical protein